MIPIYISSYFDTAFCFPCKNNIIVYLKDKELSLDLNDYLIGVVAAEMPVSFNIEALKAQAVAARSFAVNKISNNYIEILSTKADQVYKTNYELYENWQDDYQKYYAKIELAVQETNDIVIKRDGKVLKTYYFSMSNGYTENSISVFNETTFTSVSSPLENESLKNFKFETTFSKQELLNKLKINDFILGDIIRNETNHVEKVYINNKEYQGTYLRKVLGLRSTDFEIKIDGDNYIFITKGYGHGVGMSQYGAEQMAQNGLKYNEILNYYYQNTYIENI